MKNSKRYFTENILIPINNTGTDCVLCGLSAIDFNGISNAGTSEPSIFVNIEDLHAMKLRGYVNYYYKKDLQLDYLTQEFDIARHIRLPSVERAFIECMECNLEIIPIGDFYEDFCRYLRSDRCNIPLLIEVGTHFNVTEETINYWIQEVDDVDRY